MDIYRQKLTRNGIGTRNSKAKPKTYPLHAEDLIVLMLLVFYLMT